MITPKVAMQKIRKLAKRGSNEMLQRAVEEVYAAGIEVGMRKLSEELKGRINDTSLRNPQQELLEGISSVVEHDSEMPKSETPTT